MLRNVKQKTAIVVGAGFGGLSAAALLAKDGYTVTLLEKNDGPGGRARVFKEKGFTFDMGPSWYLMPDIFERFFVEFGKTASDFYVLKRLDPAYRIFFGKDENVDISSSLEKNMALFESMEQGAAEQFKKYLANSKYQYEVSVQDFLYKDYKSVFEFLSWRMLKEGRKLHVFDTLDRYTKRFFKNEKIRKILEYSMVFLGGSPKNTPAIYSLMSHIDFNLGVWYPEGGIGRVVEAFVTLGSSLGVEYKYGHEVTNFAVNDGNVTEVATNQGSFLADVVVMNGDYHFAETKLLAPEHQSYPESYWQKRTIAPSGFIIYLGLNKKIPKLAHHNLFFDHDWQRHFDSIFERPEWPEFPSYYVCCPSQTDPSVAPAGSENIFILVPLAAGLNDSDEIRQQYSEKILLHLESLLGENIRSSIVVQRIYSQRDFANDYHAFKGTALGLSHTLMQTAFFRPSRRSKKVKNLFYTGQYTHPGIGMPMTLISSQIVREEIKKSV